MVPSLVRLFRFLCEPEYEDIHATVVDTLLALLRLTHDVDPSAFRHVVDDCVDILQGSVQDSVCCALWTDSPAIATLVNVCLACRSGSNRIRRRFRQPAAAVSCPHLSALCLFDAFGLGERSGARSGIVFRLLLSVLHDCSGLERGRGNNVLVCSVRLGFGTFARPPRFVSGCGFGLRIGLRIGGRPALRARHC